MRSRTPLSQHVHYTRVKKLPKKSTIVSFFFCVKKCESLSCIIRDSLGANTHTAPCCSSLIAPSAHNEIPREMLLPFCNSTRLLEETPNKDTHTGTCHTLPGIWELGPCGVSGRCHTYLFPQETRSRKSVTSTFSHGEIQPHKLYLPAEVIDLFIAQYVLGNSSEVYNMQGEMLQEPVRAKQPGGCKDKAGAHYSIKISGKARSHGCRRW